MAKANDFIVTWRIPEMNRLKENGMVVSIHWNCEVETLDQKDYVCKQGDAILAPAEESLMIPYEELTEQECMQWLFDSLGEETKQVIENSAMAELKEKVEPSQEAGLPWK